jgi:hypothetical protein
LQQKTKVEKSGQQGPQEKSEPEDLPFGRYGLYDENSSCNARRNKRRRNESMKEEQVGKRKVRKAHCGFAVANQTTRRANKPRKLIAGDGLLLAADH